MQRGNADIGFSGAQTPDMVPMMIKSGYRALAVTFDVWGIANMVKDGMTKARALAQSVNEPEGEVKEVTLNAKK